MLHILLGISVFLYRPVKPIPPFFHLQHSSFCSIELSRTSQLLPSSVCRCSGSKRPSWIFQASGRQKVPRGYSSNSCLASASKNACRPFSESQGQGLPAVRGRPTLGPLPGPTPHGSYLRSRLCEEITTFAAAAAPPTCCLLRPAPPCPDPTAALTARSAPARACADRK